MTNSTRYPYVNETKQLGAFYVHKYSICATNCVAYSVYEAYAGHSSTLTLDGVHCGAVVSRPLPGEIDAMRGEARYAACVTRRKGLETMCLALIVTAFPEASKGEDRGMGQMEVWS